jgi:hypothetical protein
MRRWLLPFLLSLATAGLVAAVCVQAPGVNGPREWQWAYRAPGLAGGGVAAAAALAVLLVWVLRERLAASAATAPLLALLGWAFTLSLVAAQPGGFGRVVASLASRQSFGYVFDSGLAPPTRALLADYPAASAGLYQHARTHPPGPLLLVRGLDALARRLRAPRAGSGGLAATAAESLQRERQRARDRHRPSPASLPSPWTLVLLALLLPALSAAAAWPLHRLALAWGLAPEAALLAVLFWLLVPPRSLFTPSLDQALPALLVTAAWLASAGGRGGRTRAAAAGLLLWLCCFTSYGYLAALPLLALVAAAPRPGAAGRRFAWDRPAALALAFLLPWGALAALCGYDPWASLRSALAIHHTIAIAPRGYWTWLAWNPYDFALLLGPPVLGMAAAALALRRRPPALAAAIRGWWALLVLLLLSGGARGEVGRIWLLLMPFACVFAAAATVPEGEHGDAPAVADALPGALLLAAEAALALALAANMVFVS